MINEKAKQDFILHQMLKGTETIIYADSLWIIDKHYTPLYYYKVSTIDTKGIIRNYIRATHYDDYVQVFPDTTT